MASERDGNRPTDGDGGDDGDEGGDATRGGQGEDAGVRPGWRSWLTVGGALRAAAWVLGVALLGLGAYGMARGGGPGAAFVVLGVLVTPRTRAELRELCGIWHGG